jgi:cell division septum initiation protein DivIVA
MVHPPTPDIWAPREFPKTLRGYSPSPVDEAIAAAVERIDALTAENRLLTARVEELEARLSVYEERALATQEALITARTIRRETLEAAEAEAEELRARARDESARIVDEAGDVQRRAEAEAEELRRTAEAEARSEADRIRGEAKAEAARHLQKADREITTLAAQLERLEKRRSDFLDYVSKELGVASPPKRKRTRRKSQPVDIRFRRPGDDPAAPSTEVQLDG